MPLWPAGLHARAAAQTPRAQRSRRIPTLPIEQYATQVDTDIGSDGIPPLGTFGAGGGVTVSCGPAGVGQSWALDQAYVSTSVGQLDVAQCTLYVGPLPIAPLQVAANLAGGGAQFGLGGIGLQPGEFVYAVWSGGTAGATAQLRVTGTKSVLAA